MLRAGASWARSPSDRRKRNVSDLLRSSADVTLFVRSRRFGKTLAVMNLRGFFEIGCDPTIFDGLAIMREKELCAKHMGNYPVVFMMGS